MEDRAGFTFPCFSPHLFLSLSLLFSHSLTISLSLRFPSPSPYPSCPSPSVSVSIFISSPSYILYNYSTQRYCNTTTQVGDLVIPKGAEVMIPISLLHHNPRFWPDPYKFDPERFGLMEYYISLHEMEEYVYL